MELSLKVVKEDGCIIASRTGQDEVNLVFEGTYEKGDLIVIETSEGNQFYKVQVDDALGPALVYLTNHKWQYQIPFGEKKICYSPKTFYGDKHLLYVRAVTKEEIDAYRNVALNVVDQHGESGCYPHVTANVETRGESVFAAKNAINGNRENHLHGAWPYESWGINQDDEAALKVAFGRTVEVDKVVLYTRSDFPHDNWWKQVTLRFSDGSHITWDLERSDKGHTLTFDKKKIEWIQISDLIKADDPSPFPALSQIEVYGI
ncbi:MAG: hypothetical protein K0S71_984 [Clostridia bacterium]|nr:hypothetical protein [Clostridia bacterium]